jgi:hypothetical protein
MGIYILGVIAQEVSEQSRAISHILSLFDKLKRLIIWLIFKTVVTTFTY